MFDQFAKTFVLPYHFEEDQPLKLAVYDVDNASRDLKRHDFIGEAEFSLANVVVAGSELVKHLTRPGGSSHVTFIDFPRGIITCTYLL